MRELTIIAGPCAVESREHILEMADIVRESGAGYLRAMVYKPRTSPHSFQGVGDAGLEWIAEARERTGLQLVTEMLEPGKVAKVAEYADVLQIGSRNMQNFPLLVETGKVLSSKPDKSVLLKRSMCANMEEIKGALDYIVTQGVERDRIWFCERGIQPAYSNCRNTFDVNIIPILKELHYAGKVLGDPSHSTGRRELVIPIAKAAIAAGADGLEVEVHDRPERALCDGKQAILPEELMKLMRWIKNYETMHSPDQNDSGKETEIHPLREQIDCVDRQLVALLALRYTIVGAIADVKREEALPIFQMRREQEMLEARREWAREAGIPVELIEEISSLVVDFSKKKQGERMRKCG